MTGANQADWNQTSWIPWDESSNCGNSVQSNAHYCEAFADHPAGDIVPGCGAQPRRKKHEFYQGTKNY